MVTKTMKTLGLCMLILCSASIQAGLKNKIQGLPKAAKTLYDDAAKNHPKLTYGLITGLGAAAYYGSYFTTKTLALTSFVGSKIKGKATTGSMRITVSDALTSQHVKTFVEKTFTLGGALAIVCGLRKLIC